MDPMTVEAARAYLVRDGHRTDPELTGEDGYAVMNNAETHGWRPRAAWGLNGWDLGAWPLVVYLFRDRPAPGFTIDSTAAFGSLAPGDHVGYWLAEHIEGDVKVWRFPTDEARSALVDTLAFWWWANEEQPWAAGHTIDSIPEHLRGPFSWARLDAQPTPA